VPTRKESIAMSTFPRRILLATDGSEEAELATIRAVDLAQRTDSELHVVHVGVVPSFLVSYPGTLGYYGKLYEQIEEMSRELLRKQTWQVQAAGGTVAGTHLRMGEVALEIVALAEELGADLIVIGSRGLGGVRRALMGSVSDSVVRHAHCPVLVVRPEKGQAA
jgi:nucleotide-binding universal stress UspA family protein